MTLADRIVVLRAGKVEQVGTPLELYNAPANQFVAGFLGSPKMNFLPGTVAAADGDRLLVSGPAGIAFTVPRPTASGKLEGPATLGIRPEHIALIEKGAGMVDGRVQLAEQLGGSTYLHTNLPSGETLVVEVHGQFQAKAGTEVGIVFEESATHLFDAEGATLPIFRRGAVN
jgi:multiple sugar transport system ATP-binding protein